jgi:deazaflavin-dependent oxidoreductase (nitroreductase family)
MAETPRFKEPGWVTKHLFNPLVALLSKAGLSLAGSRVLEVQGRKSGEWRQTPVNPLSLDGERYLVAPRGHTQWVRNIRVSGHARLVGRSTEEFSVAELTDDEKPPVLRAYLQKWKWEVGTFFEGIDSDPSDVDLRRIAPNHPVFRIEPPA